MKRFVVIITSILVLFVFIALNYLLWDRENLVTQGKDNQASIETLTRMNMTLNQEKSRLEQQVTELQKQIQGLEDKVKELQSNVLEQKKIADERTSFITKLKTQLDIEPVREKSVTWINTIQSKKYTEAFRWGGVSCSYWGNYWTLRIFTDYFDQNVEQIQVVLDEETSQPVVEVVPIKTPDWEMSIYMRVNVTLKDGAVLDFLKPGENILHLTCTYGETLEQWTITSVFSEEIRKESESPQGGLERN